MEDRVYWYNKYMYMIYQYYKRLFVRVIGHTESLDLALEIKVNFGITAAIEWKHNIKPIIVQ